MNVIKRVEVQVRGLVQGVLFRQRAKAEAERLGLVGWVRNEPDGSVRIVAEGPEEQLQKLVKWCRKGTEWAKVEDVKVGWEGATEEFSAFEIK